MFMVDQSSARKIQLPSIRDLIDSIPHVPEHVTLPPLVQPTPTRSLPAPFLDTRAYVTHRHGSVSSTGSFTSSLDTSSRSSSFQQPLPSLSRADSESVLEDDSPRGTRSNLPKEVLSVLNEWVLNHMENPYPNPTEKKILLERTGLRPVQLSNWFINVRRRKIFKQYYTQKKKSNRKKLIDRI